MANVPVPVKQFVPAPADTPDVWGSLRTDMDRLFDTFTSRFDTPASSGSWLGYFLAITSGCRSSATAYSSG